MQKQGSITFPDPESADPTGLVAVTRELNVELVLSAYRQGIFPWSEHPVRWYSPEPRAIFVRDHLRLPRRLGRMMRQGGFSVTLDIAFDRVIRGCADAHRSEGEWISSGFVRVYNELYRLGHAHSVEVWQDDRLVGGLYGVQLGGLFAGESMFHLVDNASKVAFAYLVGQLDHIGTVLFDCQVLNEHTANLGAVCVYRRDYLQALAYALAVPSLYGGKRWPREPPPPATRAT